MKTHPWLSAEGHAMIDVLAEHCIDQVVNHNEGVASAQQLSVREKQLVLILTAERLKDAADGMVDDRPSHASGTTQH